MPRTPWSASATVLLALAVVSVSGCSQEIDPLDAGGEPPGSLVTPAVTTPPTQAGTAPATPRSLGEVTLGLEPVATGLEAPVVVAAPEGDPRLFIGEQVGRIRVRTGGELKTFLDITDRVDVGGERGLLGLAFAPDFAESGRLFVHYSGAEGRATLSEFTVSPDDPGRAAAATEKVLLTVEQPASTHNGGTVAFGPDGMLYLGLGDGGAASDRFRNGQDPSTLLGSILRLDVSTPGEAVPAPGNPFLDGGGAPEVWVYGLHNPWRFTFHRGWLYVADVGQEAVEEIDVVSADASGSNFGWPVLEGDRCVREGCDPTPFVAPAFTYRHAETSGCAIVGGEVYDGAALPPLAGHYFYGDVCAGFVRSIRVVGGEVVDERDWTPQIGSVDGLLSFGHDGRGEVYVTTQDGRVGRIVPVAADREDVS